MIDKIWCMRGTFLVCACGMVSTVQATRQKDCQLETILRAMLKTEQSSVQTNANLQSLVRQQLLGACGACCSPIAISTAADTTIKTSGSYYIASAAVTAQIIIDAPDVLLDLNGYGLENLYLAANAANTTVRNGLLTFVRRVPGFVGQINGLCLRDLMLGNRGTNPPEATFTNAQHVCLENCVCVTPLALTTVSNIASRNCSFFNGLSAVGWRLIGCSSIQIEDCFFYNGSLIFTGCAEVCASVCSIIGRTYTQGTGIAITNSNNISLHTCAVANFTTGFSATNTSLLFDQCFAKKNQIGFSFVGSANSGMVKECAADLSDSIAQSIGFQADTGATGLSFVSNIASHVTIAYADQGGNPIAQANPPFNWQCPAVATVWQNVVSPFACP